MEIKTVPIGDWAVQVGETKRMDLSVARELEEFLTHDWREAVLETTEHPYLGTALGIPSPIIRAEISPVPQDFPVRNRLFEVEARPAGLGVFSGVLSAVGNGSAPQVNALWREALSSCEAILRDPESRILDDRILAGHLGIPYFEDPSQLNGQKALWVRGNGCDEKLEYLHDHSLVPIGDDGRKDALIRLGLAKRITGETDLDFEKSFVIKPRQGTWCRDVHVFVPHVKHTSWKGTSTRSQVLRALSESQQDFIEQPFIEPMPLVIDNNLGWVIWRLFFGWIDGRYTFIGGVWSWRPNVRNHGANDTMIGLLLE